MRFRAWQRLTTTGKLFAAAALVALLLVTALRSDQLPADSVGAIEGPDIAVRGPVRLDIANGRRRTVISNGSEVTVKSGPARLDLVEGGVIGICSPAHFTVLKTASTLTVALDYGSVHARIQGNPALTVFTPLVQASLVDIGGALRDATIGLRTSGEMCVHPISGAARLEQQLTGQSFLVPQGGDVSLTGGQLDATPGAAGICGCEIAEAKNNPVTPIKSNGLSALAPTKEFHPNPPAPQSLYVPEKRKEEDKIESGNGAAKTFDATVSGKRAGPPAVDQPIYKVLMPPLTFDAASPAPPPDPSPATILLVRTVRLRPTVVFRGRVEPAVVPSDAGSEATQVLSAQNDPGKSAAPPSTTAGASASKGNTKPTVMAKVRSFFQRLLR